MSFPASHFVDTGSLRLHVLEWHGRDTPIVMIHGIGDNPHVFTDLASRLAPDFPVVAYARRGHGRSDAPSDGPYDLDAYVADLLAVIDQRGITRAHLLGWSMGGNEITAFAGRYPHRTSSVIYLDSGYDWTDATFLGAFGRVLSDVAPAGPALASLDAYRAAFREIWFGETPWTPALEEYLRETVQLGPDGAVTATVPEGPTFEALFASLFSPPREYARVTAPALALYAPRFFAAPANPSLRAIFDRFEDEVMRSFRLESQTRLVRELPGAQVQTCPGTLHMSIGVDHLDDLVTRIRTFLSAPVSAPPHP
jgi:pimeloyl-ACP methyl ester carboxylesterase